MGTKNTLNLLSNQITIIPSFFTISGVKIQLFFKDHAPPHFHTAIAEYKAIIRIADSKIIEGQLPKNKKKEVLDWAEANREILLEIWNELND